MKKLISSLVLVALCFYTLSAQSQITLAGIVVDEAGEPVIGAFVTAVEAGVSTSTDIDGHFALNCNVGVGGTSLRVSYVGMTTITTNKYTSSDTSIRIVLKDDSSTLNALQQKRKRPKK